VGPSCESGDWCGRPASLQEAHPNRRVVEDAATRLFRTTVTSVPLLLAASAKPDRLAGRCGDYERSGKRKRARGGGRSNLFLFGRFDARCGQRRCGTSPRNSTRSSLLTASIRAKHPATARITRNQPESSGIETRSYRDHTAFRKLLRPSGLRRWGVSTPRPACGRFFTIQASGLPERRAKFVAQVPHSVLQRPPGKPSLYEGREGIRLRAYPYALHWLA
jgi:hypothetical protein